jgi:hypothetical protein
VFTAPVSNETDAKPGGEKFDKMAKKAQYRWTLKSLVKAMEQGKPFSKDDLRFLYELDETIDPMHRNRPRIDGLLSKRNKREDLRVIFNCTEAELVEKEHITLKDIPSFENFPNEAEIKKNFKLDEISHAYKYMESKPTTDFELVVHDFPTFTLAEEKKRQTILEAIAKSKEQKESELVAKVFQVYDIIVKKKQVDSKHPDSLTSMELLEAIDEAGYRPATLEELLAFAKQSWKPDVDPKTLTDEEKHLQHVNERIILAFGSIFEDELVSYDSSVFDDGKHYSEIVYSGGERQVPSLYWNNLSFGGPRRCLYTSSNEPYTPEVGDWFRGDSVLVIRK